LIGHFDEDLVPAAAAQAVRAGLAVTGHFLLYRLYSSRPIVVINAKTKRKHTVYIISFNSKAENFASVTTPLFLQQHLF
jgi:hypothetical protein